MHTGSWTWLSAYVLWFAHPAHARIVRTSGRRRTGNRAAQPAVVVDTAQTADAVALPFRADNVAIDGMVLWFGSFAPSRIAPAFFAWFSGYSPCSDIEYGYVAAAILRRKLHILTLAHAWQQQHSAAVLWILPAFIMRFAPHVSGVRLLSRHGLRLSLYRVCWFHRSRCAPGWIRFRCWIIPSQFMHAATCSSRRSFMVAWHSLHAGDTSASCKNNTLKKRRQKDVICSWRTARGTIAVHMRVRSRGCSSLSA